MFPTLSPSSSTGRSLTGAAHSNGGRNRRSRDKENDSSSMYSPASRLLHTRTSESNNMSMGSAHNRPSHQSSSYSAAQNVYTTPSNHKHSRKKKQSQNRKLNSAYSVGSSRVGTATSGSYLRSSHSTSRLGTGSTNRTSTSNGARSNRLHSMEQGRLNRKGHRERRTWTQERNRKKIGKNKKKRSSKTGPNKDAKRKSMDHDYDPHLEIGLSQRTRREQRDAPINTNDENDENNYDEYDTRKYESYTASKPLGAEDMFGKSPRAKADDAWHVLTEIDAMHSAMSERDRSPDGKIAAIRRRNKARKLLGGKKSLLHSMSQPTLSSSSSARINNLKHHLNNSVINHALTPSSASSMKSSSSYLRKYNKQRRTKIKNSNAKSAKGIPRMDVGEVESDGDLDMDDDEKDFKAIAEMEEEVPGEKEYRVMLKKMQITEREKDLDQLLPVIQSKDAVSMRKIQQQTRSKFLKKNRAKILNLCEEHHQIEKDKQSMREKQQNNMTDLASEMFWLISLTEKLDSENTKLVKKLNPMEAEEFDIQQQVVMREKQALFLSNLANKYKKELSSAHGTIDKLKGEVNNMWNLNKAQAKAYNEQERHHRDTLLKELTQVRNESELYKKQLAQADTEKRQLLLKVSQLESSVIQLNARAKGVGYL